jgi:hypothetical protein
MNYNSCENCRYFNIFISDGFCLRFPQEVKKGFQDWCGEFKTSGKWEYEREKFLDELRRNTYLP